MTQRHEHYGDDPDTTKRGNGGPSWKWIAIALLGMFLTVLIAGGTIMGNTAARHDRENKENREELAVANNRLTKVETQFTAIQEQLVEIKQLIKEKKP